MKPVGRAVRQRNSGLVLANNTTLAEVRWRGWGSNMRICRQRAIIPCGFLLLTMPQAFFFITYIIMHEKQLLPSPTNSRIQRAENDKPFFSPAAGTYQPGVAYENGNTFFKPQGDYIQRLEQEDNQIFNDNNYAEQEGKNPPGWDELHKYKHAAGGTMRVTHFTTKNAANDPFSGYADKAKKLLQEHNLDINVADGGTLNFERSVQDMDDVKELRKMAGATGKEVTTRVAAISVPYSTVKGFDLSDINGQAISGEDYPPYLLINSNNKSADNVTLLHEMGHTANVPGLKDVPVNAKDAVQNFMLYGDNRTDMLKQQVIAMAKAYFAV